MHSRESIERSERTTGRIWRFADCEFDERRHDLRVRGASVDIESKPLDVLRELLTHAGEVVTKEELLEAAWPGLIVVDGSLATAVSKLRKALGDEGIVVTVPRVGYRLAVPVQTKPLAPPPWPELHLASGDPVPGRQQWRLVRRLDLSPASEVWLAEHAKTGDRRVFKFAPDAQRLKDLKREVTVARLLRQTFGERPDFVRVLEWNFDAPPYFVESEYCGLNLGEWADAQGGLQALPPDTRLRLLIDVADAVAAAHSVGVLHKDLKPGNILATGRPGGGVQIKVADFGSASLLVPARLAQLGITSLGFTQSGAESGTLTGTVMYMAPEMLAGQSPTPACDVYALGVLLYQLIVGDFRRPLAPGWEADVADPLLRQDVAEAASGDPSRRLPDATAFADRLRSLDRRRCEAAERERQLTLALAAEQKRAAARARRPWLVLAALSVGVAISFGAYFKFWPAAAPAADREASQTSPAVRAIAVLPFQNVAAETSLDFLRFALADEVSTILNRIPGLAVRPFAATRMHDQPNIDLQQIGRTLAVSNIVTGHFVKTGDQLQITLEAIDLGHNHVVWRNRVDAPARSLIATQVQMAMKIEGGLAQAFGSSAAPARTSPKNEEAYDLFLRSAALTLDPATNPQAIRMLERAVELDPDYPPAWLTLARRYYAESRYKTGDAATYQRGLAAIERAAALDPNYVAAVAFAIGHRLERGDLVPAYARASDLVRRRPDSADARFTLSYVLRFAGLLEESARQCDAAFLLNPRTTESGLRSCAFAFTLMGDYPRAMNYLQLDAGSDFDKAMTIHMLLRQRKETEALRIAPPNMPQWRKSYDLLFACVARKPPEEIRELARRVQSSEDPETNYLFAAHLAYCGQTDAALALLRRAIEGNYCSYPALQSDPLFATVRTHPAFATLVASGRECQQRFLAETKIGISRLSSGQ